MEATARKLEIGTTEAAGARWVAAAVRAKRIAPDSPQAGEEWLAGPMLVVRNLHFEAKPSFAKLPGVVFAALRG